METPNEDKKENQQDIEEIEFPNGNTAKVIRTEPLAPSTEILTQLEIEQPQALILNVGGSAEVDEKSKSLLMQLFSRGIARAAAEVEAMIIDRGTQWGVMQMMGEGVAARGRKSLLLGVAPENKVDYPGKTTAEAAENLASLEPNHTHFVLVKSDEWGGESSSICNLAKAIAERTLITSRIEEKSESDSKTAIEAEGLGPVPVVTILTSGGSVTKKELLFSVRQGWPIIVLQGSGQLADQIVELYKSQSDGLIEDPEMAEIVEEGDIYPYQIDSPIEGLQRLIKRLLKEDVSLKIAWERFGLYDYNANINRDEFNRLQFWILALGVLGTALVLLKNTMGLDTFNDVLSLFTGIFSFSVEQWYHFVDKFLYLIVVAIPITVSLLIAAVNRFSPGNKWLLLRSSAEAVKRQIYRYRTRADIYSEENLNASREFVLARKLQRISEHLMSSEISLSALREYDGPIPPKFAVAEGDDAFSVLSPERYVTYRLEDQINYYRRASSKLGKKLKKLQWLIYGFGALGTLLAALEYEIWIALTTALVGAFSTYIQYQQLETKMMKYLQTASDLENVRAWWFALSSEEQAKQKNIDILVRQTEQFLESEISGWIQEMQEALAELRSEQTKKEEAAELNSSKHISVPPEDVNRGF